MATIRKPAYSIPIPVGAKVVERDGKRAAEFVRDGRRVTAPLTRDGTKCRVELPCWYVRYRDLDGKWKEVKAYTDKRASLDLAEDIQTRLDQRQQGIIPYKEHHERPLAEHLADWKQNMLDRGNDARETSRMVERTRKILSGCGFKAIPDMRAVDVESYLAKRRVDAKRPMAPATHNYYVVALRRFCKRLIDQERTGSNPMEKVAKLKVTKDQQVHPRRALDPAEFSALIQATVAGPPIDEVSGPDRAMIYILAAWTGYRRKELASLTLRSFDLDGPTPTVNVKAGRIKNKQAATIPLHAAVVNRMRAWLETKPDLAPDVPLFDLRTAGGYWKRTERMMRRDLERAGLPYQDENGFFADFHANRHTFISNLARGGVPLTTAQKLARHSDPKLTANIYTHLGVCDLAGAIQSLHAPPPRSCPPAGTYPSPCLWRCKPRERTIRVTSHAHTIERSRSRMGTHKS